MPAATDRIEFAPPPAPGRLSSLALAVLAHVLLMLALTWGITWNREPQDMAAEAELWASVPQEAAPPPAPPPQPVVQAPPLQAPTPPQPEPKVEAPPPPAPPKQPDINLEQQKRKQEEARRQELEREKLEARKRQQELDRKKELEAQRKREELEKQKQLEARRKQEEDKRKLAEKKKAEELAKKAKQEQEAKLREQLRQDTINRMRSLASGTGGPSSKGTAQHASGPSGGYGAKVRARVKPNIVFTDVVTGNPTAEVEVRTAPDGTIVGKRLVKSSGVPSWDEAVLRAIDKTERMPRDIDGTVPSPLLLTFRPKD